MLKGNNMKTSWCLLKLSLLFFSLWACPRTAHAYYDPGVQRWISRDPFHETGHRRVRGADTEGIAIWNGTFVSEALIEPTPYLFVQNSPLLQVDSYGLISIPGCPCPLPPGFTGWCTLMCARTRQLPLPSCWITRALGHTYITLDCGCWPK